MTAGPLIDTDLWWHLANGRYIVAHGIPSRDVFSFTVPGAPWVVHEWLTDLAMYGMYRLAGLAGLVLAAAAIVAVAEYFVYRLLRRAGLGNNSAILVAVLLGVAASPSWGARPQVITFLLVAVLVEVLLRYRDAPGRWIFWLLPAFVLWANLHPGFLLGAALVAVVALAEALGSRMCAVPGETPLQGPERRRLWYVAAGGLLAGIVTPSGAQTYLAFYKVVASPVQRGSIAEWASPDFHPLPGMVLLLLILLLVAGGVSRARAEAPAAAPTPSEAALGIVMLGLALNSQRNVALFAVAGAPLMGRSVAAILGAMRVPAARPRVVGVRLTVINLGLAAVLAVLAVAVRVAPSLSPANLETVVAHQFPVAALHSIEPGHQTATAPPTFDPMFNAYDFGGYVIWKDGGGRPVFIDGRAEVYGDRVLSEYLDVAFLSPRATAVLDRYGVQSVLVHSGGPLGPYLLSVGWQLYHADSVAEVYVRGSGGLRPTRG